MWNTSIVYILNASYLQVQNKYLKTKLNVGVDSEEAKQLHRVVVERLQDLKVQKRRNHPSVWR